MFSHDISTFRYNNNLSQRQLAVLLEVDQTSVTRWEKGTVKPSEENRAKFYDLIYSYNEAGQEQNNGDSNNLHAKENILITNFVNDLIELAKEYTELEDKNEVATMIKVVTDQSKKRELHIKNKMISFQQVARVKEKEHNAGENKTKKRYVPNLFTESYDNTKIDTTEVKTNE